MKRKPPVAKAISPLLKACGNLANEAGFQMNGTSRRTTLIQDVRLAGLLGSMMTSVSSLIRVVGEDEQGILASGRVGNPMRAIWSVTVRPTSDDGTGSPIVDLRNLPFADALRIASALIQTHKFKRVANGA